MRYTKQPGRLGQYWLTKRPGRAGWYITWLDPKTRQTRRKTTGASDLADAQKLFTLGERFDREKLSDVPLVTLLERYYTEHARKLPSGKQARFALRKMRHYFGDATLADFGKKDQEKFAESLRLKGLSESYISRIFSVAKAAIRRAFDNEEIDRVPPMLHFAKSETRDRVLTLEEAAALFNSAKSESQWLYLLLAFCTGARPTAILELTTTQIDCEARLIQLNPHGRRQNKKRRPVVAIPDVLLPCLKSIPAGPVVNYGGNAYIAGPSARSRAPPIHASTPAAAIELNTPTTSPANHAEFFDATGFDASANSKRI